MCSPRAPRGAEPQLPSVVTCLALCLGGLSSLPSPHAAVAGVTSQINEGPWNPCPSRLLLGISPQDGPLRPHLLLLQNSTPGQNFWECQEEVTRAQKQISSATKFVDSPSSPLRSGSQAGTPTFLLFMAIYPKGLATLRQRAPLFLAALAASCWGRRVSHKCPRHVTFSDDDQERGAGGPPGHTALL